MFKLIFDIRMVLGVLCLGLSTLVIKVRSPQLMVICLIIQAFIVSILLGFLKGLWYSYVLFLVFLGGILVVFIYIRRLASWVKVDNQYYILIKLLRVILVLLFIDLKDPWLRLVSREFILFNEGRGVVVLISSYIVFLYLFIVRYLILTLFIVCRMVKLVEGPLRKFSFKHS